MSNCGHVTHEKGSSKIKAHTSFAAAVEHAKKQHRVTAVVAICDGRARVVTRCKDGGCGGGLSGVRRRSKVSKKRRARRRS